MSKKELVHIAAGAARMEGMLEVPDDPVGVVLFAHGSGSSRLSPRNNYVAGILRESRIGTLMLDLLTAAEDRTYENRFDISLLTGRLGTAAEWLRQQPSTAQLKTGLFGASTGAAAALELAAGTGVDMVAVVSRGGRPDLAGHSALMAVRAPTLLIVGGADHVVIGLNRRAYDELRCEKQIVIVPGATHLFEEPGALEEVARLATQWFVAHFPDS
jgi:putative phosphoribosyl transferase